MYDLETLKAIIEARKHLKGKRELTSFENGRIINLKVEDRMYRVHGYLEENILFFDLKPYIGGIDKEPVAVRVPLVAQIACLSDHYHHDSVRCRNLSGNYDWIIEFTKTLNVILSEYELLPGSQPEDSDGSVYLVNDESDILSVEARFLTIFEPTQDVFHRMAIERAITAFQKHMMEAPSSAVNKEFVNTAFMCERSLNAGHVDMISLDPNLVLESAANQLMKIGELSIIEDIRAVQIRLEKERERIQKSLGFEH
ncbi:MAG: hypothetical protein CL693_00905 [Cellvibrionaceae bacterium]|nr:hypothetical protein [Cellvibrionaceae bacterium]